MPRTARPSKPDTSAAPATARDTARADVEAYYRLFLAREPESEAAFEVYANRDPAELLPVLANAPEFIGRVVEPLERGEDPWALEDKPSSALVAWIARTLPLTPAGARKLRKSGETWPRLFQALTADARFREVAGGARLTAQAAVQTLRNLSLVAGQIERADAAVVSGWAGPIEVDGPPATVELWIDGAFVAATTADGFRRDIQDRIGGDGLRGFAFTLPRPLPSLADPVTVSVTVGPERVSIGQVAVSVTMPEMGLIRAYREEIQTLKTMIERLEQSLPALLHPYGGTIDEWDAYYQAWYPGLASVERPEEGRWSVLMDADAATPAEVQAAVASVVDQAISGDQIILIASPALEPFARDLAVRARAMGGATVRVVEVEAGDPGERVGAGLGHLGANDLVLLVEAGATLAPPALAMMTSAFAASGAMKALYVDEDAFAPDSLAEAPDRAHCCPELKPDFDVDLLLQMPFIGSTLAFRAQALTQVGLRSGCGGLHGPDAVLRLGAAPGAIGHLPRVLVTRAAPHAASAETETGWLKCVTDHLAASGENATAEPHRDSLGVRLPGALRIRRSVTDASATIIIPTRERLDLLQPCIDSLVAREVGNSTRMDIRIVDHESEDPAVKAYLAELAESGRVSIMPFSGAFNWALMNNLAAAEAIGDVLVFLNNDTIALSPDWLDELVGQAMREEVGIVGCRMIYPDGALQHGGFVSRGDGRHALIHDGVGEPGADGGYLGRYALLRRSPLVTGACLAVRRSVFETLGGFDAANFPVEGNDADLCFRARAAGLRVLYDPYATLYHLESKSRGFSVTPEKRAAADAAMGLLQRRWPDQYGVDPGFNPHFDRNGRPFTRLRPPPPCKIPLA